MQDTKMIEEMAKMIHGYCKAKCADGGCSNCVEYMKAKKLYNAGYRKQKEGEWIYHEWVSSYDGAISGYSCSECCILVNEEVFDSDEFHKSFCGNCGAKMEGGVK